MMITLIGLGILAAATAAPGVPQGTEPVVRSVDAVDLERYAGRWFEIARLPNRFQKRCGCCVTASYELRPDGRLTVVNECRGEGDRAIRAEGEARLADPDGPSSRLKVRFAPGFLSFLPFVWGDYWILELAPDYGHVLIGEPKRKYLWILAREPALPDEVYERLLGEAESMGYDISKVERTAQAE
jgi:apolipoprotein D and lipocalin family protein